MNTNNNYAPEKLYLHPNGLISFCRNTENDIEYTRTDAFIEKATLWLLTNANDYCILHNSYDTEELVKDFVDAMKKKFVMTQYIDKSALVAEIERRKEKCDTFYNIAFSNNAEFAKVAIKEQKKQYDSFLSFLDTLEVKEVDLDVMQRMKECPYRQVGCTMYEGHILECRGACSWVVDYLKLKELKAQKGE